jgi:bifunctional DNA-binding transcriptional regulator/antitoxin component of YhaV-PrlF toxin-antitoxin module
MDIENHTTPRRRYKEMVEVTTLTKATPKSDSLRTTVPSYIVKLLELKEGDKIIWTTTIQNNQATVTIKPLKE